MDNLTLTAKYRTDLTKSGTKAVRKNHAATATVYGHGVESVSIEVDLSDLVTLYKASKASGASIIDIKVEGAPTNVDGTVVMKTVTKNPLSRRVIDVEFQRVSMTEKVTVDIPVKFVGDCKGIVEGGVVEEAMNELHVRALPGTLPAFIEVDITDLELGGHISVSNLELPEGVEVLNDLDTTLVACVYPFKGGQRTEEKTEAPAATE